jgi:chitinase
MQTYGFDGIDVDWEYPVEGGLSAGRPEDTENFTLLMAAFRERLQQLGGDHLLTIAAPAGDGNIANIQPAALAEQLDWINVMTYDFYGAWDATTGFVAPLHATSDSPHANNATFNAEAAVQAYLDAGVPADKIVMGIPLYGRGWGGVGATDDGLYQPASGASSIGTWEAGVFDYADLVERYLDAGDWTRGWHEEALVPWLYSASQGVFISYDDAESVSYKLDYIEAEGLGGAMLWELDADTAGHELVREVSERLR